MIWQLKRNLLRNWVALFEKCATLYLKEETLKVPSNELHIALSLNRNLKVKAQNKALLKRNYLDYYPMVKYRDIRF